MAELLPDHPLRTGPTHVDIGMTSPFLGTTGRLLTLAVCWLVLATALTAGLAVISPRAAALTGLERRVYLGTDFSGAPILDDVTSKLTLDFLDDHSNLPRRNFSVRWRCFWVLPQPLTIELRAGADDQVEVRIDGASVMRRGPAVGMGTVGRTLSLAAGTHEVVVEYVQRGGGLSLNVDWRSTEPGTEVFAAHEIFRAPPDPHDVALASAVVWLRPLSIALWTPLPIVGLLATGWVWTAIGRRRWQAIRDLYRRHPVGGIDWQRYLHGGSLLLVLAMAWQAATARLPGMNPESLWFDDFVYGAVVRSESFWNMLTAPIHVAPGLFVLWRGLHALFPDPEWSLQLLPFACSLAAIPVMTLAVRHVTDSVGLGLLAGALTALNPLGAQYAVYVHQYAFDFLVTALFLLAASHLFDKGDTIDTRRFAWMALAGGVAIFFSVPSVFISASIMHVGAWIAIRNWTRDRATAVRTLRSTAAYDATVLAGYLLLRGRSNEAIRSNFAEEFMPYDSAAAAAAFLAESGRRALESALGFEDGVLWPLFLLGLGLIWLLSRPRTRGVGLTAISFYVSVLAASALGIYPIGGGRTDIFAFPVAICGFAAGVHLVTEALPRAAAYRTVAALTMVAMALSNPVHVTYRPATAVRLIEELSTRARPEDALIMTWWGAFPAAYYGRWPVRIEGHAVSNGVRALLVRDRTLHLPFSLNHSPDEVRRDVAQFLDATQAERVWFISYFSGWAPWQETEVVAAVQRNGMTIEPVADAVGGRLWLGVAD